MILDDNKIRIVCGEGHHKSRILSDVKKSGLKVKSQEVSKSTLEDIFLELTGIGDDNV